MRGTPGSSEESESLPPAPFVRDSGFGLIADPSAEVSDVVCSARPKVEANESPAVGVALEAVEAVTGKSAGLTD